MKFARSALASILIVALVGCISQSQIAALAQILGTTAASIASIEGNPTLAAKLTTDTDTAVTAINNWKSGTPTDDVVQVLNLVEDDLNLFPQVGPYVPLIQLALATVISILALLPPPQATVATRAARTHVVIPGGAPKSAKEYKHRFNALVDANPAIPQTLKVK